MKDIVAFGKTDVNPIKAGRVEALGCRNAPDKGVDRLVDLVEIETCHN